MSREAGTPAVPGVGARARAIVAGQKTYSTGRVCRAGHSSPRYASSGVCVACSKERSGAEPAIISRDEARQRGLKRFWLGEPCRRGHRSPRLVSDGTCIECNRGWRQALARNKVVRQLCPHGSALPMLLDGRLIAARAIL
jgi:hypothetical protein